MIDKSDDAKELLSKLINERNLDDEVIECIKRDDNNSYLELRLLFLETLLRHMEFDNKWFRYHYCLDPMEDHIECIKRHAEYSGNDPNEKVKKYIDWQESTKVRNLTRNLEYLEIYGA
jgi:hypothetical protein